ncbi:MAG: cation:proton antiporter [Erysipelotrichaceae bacterium]|nr:cation:proton antiporter [Erysipelotrichaceae bacterium]
MLASLALMILVGLSLASIVEKLKLPRIIGLLVTGIILGPYVLNVLDESILNISSQLRQIALIIILIKAGLTLNLEDLKKVGRPALLMAFLPATFELIAYIIFAPLILNVTRVEAALMGAVLAAVSPAVVVPRMVYLIENQYGTKKGIPQMILAGASCDDIYVIVLFSTFVTMAQGGSVQILDFVNIPISIILGIVLGIVAGFVLAFLFKHYEIENSMKMIIIMGIAFLLMSIETWLEAYISLSGLLAVVSMSCVIKLTSSSFTSSSLASITGKLWLFAEIMLFVLVGAAVDIRYALSTGIGAILMIFVALVIRAIGVWICLIGTNLNIKERIFCIIAYLPKATVQAAIGSVPLSLGLSCGPMILSVAVLAILITAPLGAIGIDRSYTKILVKENI